MRGGRWKVKDESERDASKGEMEEGQPLMSMRNLFVKFLYDEECTYIQLYLTTIFLKSHSQLTFPKCHV